VVTFRGNFKEIIWVSDPNIDLAILHESMVIFFI